MNNKRQSNRLFTMLMLVMAIIMPYGGAWAQTPPSKGDGKKDSPYIITKAEELAWFRDQVNGGNKKICAKIADNVEVIDLKNFCHAADASKKIDEQSWVPIGNSNKPYQGTFDGNGKTITNLYINASQTSQNNMGLFGYTYQSTIKNLTFENANVTNTQSNTGILVGKAGYGSTLQNIKISKTCQIKGGNYTGGIAGELDGNAYNCVNYATVQGTQYIGGLFGDYSRTGNSITACANYGNVTASSVMAGGLVGYFRGGTIQDCANYGKITSTGWHAGGIAGKTLENSSIQNVFSYGDVTNTNTNDKPGIIIATVNGTLTAKGIVAYNKEALLNNSSENIKTVGVGSLTFEDGKVEADVVKAFTKQQIKSGEVALALNDNKTSGDLSWYQKLGENGDAYPVLKSTGDNTVYHGKECDKITDVYTNDNSIFGEDGAVPHVFEMAGHPDANGLYGDVCINCNANNENIKYIQHFCGIIGNNLKLTYDDGKYYAETVTLTDGEAYNSPVDIEVADFKYIRTFDAYKWQSLYVPFRMSLEQLTSNGLNVATPVDIEVVNETITRLNVQKLKSGFSKANYPSLIMCESDGEKTIELADVTLSAAKEGAIDCMSMTRYYVFNGVYQANKNLASNSEDAINYIIKDGGLVLRTDEDVPAPQSWYMNVTIRENPFGGADEPLSSDAKTMPIYVIGEGYATGIENVNTAEEHILHGIYDLQGRKLSQEPESGIYIKDGKKYVK